MEKYLQRGFVIDIDMKRYEHNVELGEFVQGDIKSSYLGFNIKNGNRPYDLTDCEVIYQIKKPDGTKVSSIGEISMPTRGYVECAIGGQALLIDGICELELSILKNGAKLTSHKIRYMVNPSLFETIGVSQDEVTVLSQLMDRVHEYAEIVRTEEEKRNNSENSRIENEKQRELAETDRDARFDKMVNDLEELKPTFKGEKGEKGDRGADGSDGKSIEFTWRGTELGVRQSGTLEYLYTDLKGDKGDCESIDLNNFYNKQEADNRFIDEEELNDKGYLTEHQDISGKVDKVEGKQLSTEDYTTLEKAKLSNVEEGANKYIHPSTHSANIIEQDSNHRFVTDEEKSKWNSQVDSNQLHTHSNKNTLDKITEQKLTSWDSKSDFSGSYNDLTDRPNIPSIDGLAKESYVNSKVIEIVGSAPESLNTLGKISMALENNPNFADSMISKINKKASMDYVTSELNKKVNIENYVATENNYTSIEKAKLQNIEENANNYSHPEKHEASIIIQDKTHRFVTDIEKQTWNSKANKDQLHNHSNKEILDTITQERIEQWDGNGSGNVVEGHTHNNKAILDKIIDSRVENWDTAYTHSQTEHNFASLNHNHEGIYKPIDYVPSWNEVADKPSTFVPSTHNQASNTINTMTGYVKPPSTSAIGENDSLNTAIGKIEKALEGKQPIGSYAPASHAGDDVVHITANERTKWNAKSDLTLGITTATAFRGDQGLVAYNHSQEAHAPANAEQNVQADWNEDNASSDAYIKNKPTIPTVDVNKAYVDAGLTKKANATDLHSHDNKVALDTVTSEKIASWDAKSNFSGSYNDLTNKPTIPSISGLATESYVNTKVAGIVDSSPETLDTLKELSEALGNDSNFATTITNQIGTKADKSHNHNTDYASKSSEHNHANKTVLDTVNDSKVTNWDDAYTHSQTAHNYAPATHRHNASEIDNLPSGSIDSGANNNWTGTNTFTNLVKIIGNNEVQRMEPANANSACYYTFYKDKQSRSGYFGYGSSYNNTFVIGNDVNGADVNVETKGTGRLKANGKEVVLQETLTNAIGNHKIWSGTQVEYDAITNKDANTIYFIKKV